MTREYDNNVLLGYILCPSHTEQTPSCAVYTTKQARYHRLYCYGCGYKAPRVTASEVEQQITKPQSAPSAPYCSYRGKLPGVYDVEVIDFFDSRGVLPEVATEFGVYQLDWDGPTAIMLPTYDVARQVTGGQLRILEPKKGEAKIINVRHSRKHTYPSYGYYKFGTYRLRTMAVPVTAGEIVIVESVIDALHVLSTVREWSEEHRLTLPPVRVGCIALLGTHISDDVREVLYQVGGLRSNDPGIWLCGDGDIAGRRCMSGVAYMLRHWGIDCQADLTRQGRLVYEAFPSGMEEFWCTE